MKRVRDFAEVRADGSVTGELARDALVLFEVDELGLDKVDRAVLGALCTTFGGRAVGLHTLAVAVAEEPETVEEVYEPFLLKAGLLDRTPAAGWPPRPPMPTSGSLHRPRLPLPICSPRPPRAEANDR